MQACRRGSRCLTTGTARSWSPPIPTTSSSAPRRRSRRGPPRGRTSGTCWRPAARPGSAACPRTPPGRSGKSRSGGRPRRWGCRTSSSSACPTAGWSRGWSCGAPWRRAAAGTSPTPSPRCPGGARGRRRVLGRPPPDLVVTMHWGDTWTAADVSPASWNSADHRALGRCTLDAVGDAANEWLFPELAELELEPWDGVSWTAISTPIGATHVVDVTDVLDRAVASLAEHGRYLEALSDDPVDMQAQRHVDMATAASTRSGGRRVVGFALYAA